MINSYRIHETGTDNKGYKIGYIERVDNYLFIASGILLTYEQWLSVTDFEKDPNYRIINMFRHEDGNIIILATNDYNKNQYIIYQPL